MGAESLKKVLKFFWPQKLKNRLFLAFVLLILLPFFVINMYAYSKIEDMIQVEVSKQSAVQLDNLKQSLQDQMSIAFRTALFLEHDSTVRSILKDPDKRGQAVNTRLMEEKFRDLGTSFFLYSPSTYFMVIDLKNSVYSSYLPKETFNYQRVRGQFDKVLTSDTTYLWVPFDNNDIFRDTSTSTYLLSLYYVLKDNSLNPYGVARVSLDYRYWFESMIRSSTNDQQYYIVSGTGLTIAQTDDGFLPEIMDKILSKSESDYIIDYASESLIKFSYIDALDWYVIAKIPLDILFSKLQALRSNIFVIFSFFMITFIIIALLIAYTITRPLSHMQRKMSDAVRNNLQLQLPEHKYKGELLDLAKTYNTMLIDMKELIQRLKTEQRQKDAVQFHMLLAQVNPHFLLNTLNTMKWIALRHEQASIAEICMSLGKLLETSLNSDVDLIYLKDELELIRAYVYIQLTRYNHNFIVHYEHEERNDYVLVPKLSLQPLVENAIQHAISNRLKDGFIVIRIKDIQQKNLVLEVQDNGGGFEKAILQKQTKRKRPGIGLENIRQRLKLLFKDQGKVEIVSNEEGSIVRLVFPYMLSIPYRNGEELDVESNHC